MNKKMKPFDRKPVSARLLCVLVFGLLVQTLVSCEDYKDCNSPVDTAFGMHFYQMNRADPAGDEPERDSTLPAVTFYPLDQPDGDSLLLQGMAAREIFAPLNPHDSSTRFYLQPDSTMTTGDTLTVTYTLDLHFVSAGCGFTHFYRLDTVTATRHYIDSLAFTNRKINTTHAVNVKLYY